eukprot:TRINITY_DN1681_c0_g1_i2.p1 TRINITY_DN1681_c0_g1~~TRINITY_DN1681_c0_g1_i2.p1  ORF type:complete len:218 (+),score=33.53 TRINITY_DN1681_c0_g1_i2:539-1192(+)
MHWCHQCEQRIVATPQFTCPNCNSEFIEELEGDPMDIAGIDVPATQIFQNVNITTNQIPGRRPAIIIQQVGRPNQNRMPFPFPFAFPLNPGIQQTSQTNPTGVEDLNSPDMFNQLMNQITQAINGTAVNRPGVNVNAPPAANVFPFGQLFNAMFGMNFQQDLFSSNMENLLNHLFETARCQGPPPASADYVSKLPVVKPADKTQIGKSFASAQPSFY